MAFGRSFRKPIMPGLQPNESFKPPMMPEKGAPGKTAQKIPKNDPNLKKVEAF